MSARIVRAGELALGRGDLEAIARRAGVGAMSVLDGYENAVYRSYEPTPSIIRITHTSRRTRGHVEAEADFLRALDEHGVPVAAPLGPAPVFEHETEESGTVVCLITRVAPGTSRPAAEWDERSIARYGSVVGRMHAVARELSSRRLDRPRWDDPIMLTAEHDIGTIDRAVARRSAEVVAWLRRRLRGTPEHLIHQDAHLSNLHITPSDDITLFDFDDCAYGPADADLAMVVFYWVAGRRLADEATEVRRLLDAFLPGYLTESPGHVPDAELIDAFLTYRELDIYAITAGEGHDDSWARIFLEGRRERIAAAVPYLGVPFAAL